MPPKLIDFGGIMRRCECPNVVGGVDLLTKVTDERVWHETIYNWVSRDANGPVY